MTALSSPTPFVSATLYLDQDNPLHAEADDLGVSSLPAGLRFHAGGLSLLATLETVGGRERAVWSVSAADTATLPRGGRCWIGMPDGSGERQVAAGPVSVLDHGEASGESGLSFRIVVGPTGQSAYQAAVDGGFEGTEAEFNTAVAGLTEARDQAVAALAQIDALLANMLAKSANLSDVASPAAARANLGAAAASHQHAQSDVTGLASALAAKADLVDGVVPTSQIPARALVNAVPVTGEAAMLALTSAVVQPGDIAIRSDGGGTWMLTEPDPSVIGSWVLMAPPTSEVTSVNGQVGTVVLGATDIGAATPAEVASAVDAVEVLAAGYAASAQGSAESASSSAGSAATSAAAAETARSQAVTAKTDAETARTDALQAKVDAQNAAAAVPSWWAGTQTAYNALGSYDATRLYVITAA